MNTTYRSIWNAALGAWVAVSEITRACGKRSGGAAVALVLLGASVCSSVGAQNVVLEGISHTVPGSQSSPWTMTGSLTVGNTGTGALTVSNGGTVSSSDGYLGQNLGAVGNVRVRDKFSTWTNSTELLVGNNGTGTLTVSDGGTVSSVIGVIGLSSGSTGNATVTGAGAAWRSTQHFVGSSGTGTLTVQDGGRVSTNGDGSIGYNATGIGHVTVTGAGAIWTNSNRLFVGTNGTATLTVANGGHVSANGTGFTVAQFAGSTGVLNIGAAPGSAAQAAGTVAAAVLNFGAGTGRLNFNHTDTAYTFGTRITGAGVLNHYAGTTILTGTNTYSGGTTVSGGVLQGNSTSLQGNILNNAAVNFAQAVNGTYAGTMSGVGNLSKTGAGTLTLSGANTYTGSTSVTAGTLTAGAVNTFSGNSATTVSLGATLALAGSNQTIGSLAGAGNITLGSATLTSGGNNTSTSFSGAISGSGGLTKTGTGSLTLSGVSVYSGGTTVTAGTLQGDSTSLQGSIANNAAVNFDQASAGTYAGTMSGNGMLTKLGAGNLILTGTNTYTGATTANVGTLSVNGSIANSAVTVNSGGILGGSGTLGNTSIASGGVLAPGNSIGTLSVNGNLSFAAGSTYRVEVDAAGNNDRINVTGTATINGGTVDVQAAAGTYAINARYTLLNASVVTGRFDGVSGSFTELVFLAPTLSYDANNVFLTLARNNTSFSAIAITPNQIATATALQNAEAGATGDMSTVTNAVTGLSAAQARAAYDSVSGAGLVALRNAGASFASGFGNQVQARLGAVQGGGSTRASAFAGGPILLAANDRVSDLMAPVSDTPQKFSLAGGVPLPSASTSQGRGFWLRGSGGYQDTKGDGNATASELRNSSTSAGFDAELREGLVLGAALSSGASRLSLNNADAGKSRGSGLALYGSYASGPWAFKGSASAAWHSNQMDRAVTVGALSRTASSDFDSTTLSAYGEAAYSIAMAGGWTLQPLAALSVSRSKTDGFTETGAGALNLQVAGQTVTSTKSLLGAKASFEAGSVRLEPRVIWAHEFGDINTPMTAQFQGAATASPFQVSGVALKRDTLILGLGASGRVGQGVDLFADVQLEHNQRQRNLAVLMGVRVRW